jgi:hypothetical protein
MRGARAGRIVVDEARLCPRTRCLSPLVSQSFVRAKKSFQTFLQDYSAQPQGMDPLAKVGCRISEVSNALFRFPD